jgi:hypothetical protein
MCHARCRHRPPPIRGSEVGDRPGWWTALRWGLKPGSYQVTARPVGPSTAVASPDGQIGSKARSQSQKETGPGRDHREHHCSASSYLSRRYAHLGHPGMIHCTRLCPKFTMDDLQARVSRWTIRTRSPATCGQDTDVARRLFQKTRGEWRRSRRTCTMCWNDTRTEGSEGE